MNIQIYVKQEPTKPKKTINDDVKENGDKPIERKPKTKLVNGSDDPKTLTGPHKITHHTPDIILSSETNESVTLNDVTDSKVQFSKIKHCYTLQNSFTLLL